MYVCVLCMLTLVLYEKPMNSGMADPHVFLWVYPFISGNVAHDNKAVKNKLASEWPKRGLLCSLVFRSIEYINPYQQGHDYPPNTALPTSSCKVVKVLRKNRPLR